MGPLLENPLIILAVLVAFLLLFIIIAVNYQGKGKGKPGKKPVKAHEAVEIDAYAIVNELELLAPSEQKKKKAEYIGRMVEIPCIVHKVKKSEHGDTWRHLVLQYRHRRIITVIGDVDGEAYSDHSWMTREGQVRVSGKIREIMKNEFYLDDLKII